MDIKRDANDVAAKVGTRGLADMLVAMTAKAAPTKPSPKIEDKSKQSQSSALVELATEAECWHTQDMEPYATMDVNGHAENWRLRSDGFRRWLVGRYYRETNKAPGSQALQDALAVLAAKATYDGTKQTVFVRVAEHEGSIYFDLADETWRVIEIAKDGWKVLDKSPVKFVRSRGMLSIPEPLRGGSLAELRPLINCPDDNHWAVVLAWLIGCLHPRGPFPVLAVNGEQASAKTTLCKMLRMLVDPHKSPLRSEPKDVRDLMIAATHCRVYALDNVSGIQSWLSDALCRVSSGGGYSTRELHTDEGEVVFDVCRPIMLNGIEDLATRSDLLDRCLSICLPTIPEDARREEKTLWEGFFAARPRILGALLDATVSALKNHEQVKLNRLPRMADHARWAVAAEAALGLPNGAVLTAIEASRSEANSVALEASPVAGAVLRLMEGRQEFVGTATVLLKALEGYLDWDSDARRKKLPHYWPQTAKGMASSIRRLAPNLRRAGILVEFHREAGGARPRVIRLARDAEPTSDEETGTISEPVLDGNAFTCAKDDLDYDDDNVFGVPKQ